MIKLFKVAMSKDAVSEASKVLTSGMIGEGPKVKEFKECLESLLGLKNILPLSSGTAALTLALRLSGVEGKEVITTPFTMIATNVAIMAAGGIPVFADINPDNVMLNAESVKSKINKNTGAIVLTHVGGVPCDMNEYADIYSQYPIIQDAAHALLTYWGDHHVARETEFAAFSFQSIKHLTCGDGGALVCLASDDYKRAERLKWFGMTREIPPGKTRLEHQMTADVEEWGYKYHMNDVAAAIGLGNIDVMKGVILRQNCNADYLRKALADIPGVTLPRVPEHSRPSYWSVLQIFVENRNDFMANMEAMDVETTPMWRRNDQYTCFKQTTDLPNMTELQDKIVFIPCGWWLNKSHLDEIINCIKEAV